MRETRVDKNDNSKYKEMKKIFEKSIVAKDNLKKGIILDIDSLAFKKPGDGIPASSFKEVIGKKLNRDLQKDSKISWDDLIWKKEFAL